MDPNEHIVRVICQEFAAGRPVVLATVIDVQGSSPRHRGAKMVVTADGISHGTIGGSLLEAKAIEGARRALTERRSEFIEMDLDTDAPGRTGMVCGGKVIVMIDCLPADAENRSVSDRWDKAIPAGTSFHFLTFVPQAGKGLRTSRHALLFAGGEVVGDVPAWASQSCSAKGMAGIHATTVLATDDGRIIIDPIKRVKTLYCFGTGHVAVPTAHIAATVGFHVVVMDDRAEFANAARFPDADQIIGTDNYQRAFAGLKINEDSFVVIMTRGHQFDRVVLEQALKTRAGYIGMISSRHKRDTVFRALRAKGFRKLELERVHAPIGIDIGSETPEEIAVSIVAELVKVRAGQSA